MKNKNVRGILALVIVTALSFGVIAGSSALAKDQEAEQGQAQVKEELDVSGNENIQAAAKTEEGYLVTAKAAGYGGDVIMEVSFGEDKATVTDVRITEQNETEGVGSKITEEEFLSQFAGVKAPVYLPGMTLETEEAPAEAEDLELQDGTYEAKAETPDNNGYTDQVTITVSGGKITEAVWDSIDSEGNKKSELSENGQYVMTEDGPTWAEQSQALGKALVENQSLGFLTMDNQGKTDAVSGVSIAVGGFADLAKKCIDQAAGIEAQEEVPQEGTQVDGISGATVSSKAAVEGINAAYEFLQTID